MSQMWMNIFVTKEYDVKCEFVYMLNVNECMREQEWNQ